MLGAPVDAILNGPKQDVGPRLARYRVMNDARRQLWLECSSALLEDESGKTFTVRCFSDLTAFDTRAICSPTDSPTGPERDLAIRTVPRAVQREPPPPTNG